MANMFEKSFKNEELGFELTSYIDRQQNVWFKGKDVAVILGYSDTKQAIRKHVSTENKIIQLSRTTSVGGVKTTPQQDCVGGVKTTPQQNYARGKCCPAKTAGQVRKSYPAKTAGQQNCVGVLKRHLNKMMPEGNIVHLLMSLAFMNLFLVLN